MAVAEMKRVSVLLLRGDHERLLRLLQRFGCVQLMKVDQPEGGFEPAKGLEAQELEEDISRLRWAIAKLSRFDKEKKSMFTPLPGVGLEALESGDHSHVMGLVAQAEQLERQSGDLRGNETRLRQQEEQLLPWLELDIPSSLLKDTSTCRMFTGQASAAGLEQMIQDWSGRPAYIRALGNVRDSANFYALVHQSQAEEFLQALRGIGYQHAEPAAEKGTADKQYKGIQESLQALQLKNEEIEREMLALAAHLPALRLAYEALSAKKARLEAEANMAHTSSAALLRGWVPAYAADALGKRVQAEFPVAQVAFSDPEAGEEPPVLLHNQPLVKPYEAVVSSFALPASDALDPSAVMMPFFACLFGMMVSDAGYGLLMAILIPVMVKVMKPSEGARKIFWILAGGGVATIFWGALYNTWFGFAPFPSVFDPVNNSLPVMAVCIGIGALHLFAGLALGMVQNIRRGRPLDALYDQFSWVMIVVGAGLLVLPQTAALGKWMAIAGAGIVLLTAGRNKSKNPLKRLLSGLGALYGVTSWISDLLSYMRLFGMGLATGVIGMVINQLVGMMMSGGFIGIVLGAVIFVGAHLFNAAINILGAYVHACRLQYIEFFGKFFEEGGKSFHPLRFSPRYVRVEDHN